MEQSGTWSVGLARWDQIFNEEVHTIKGKLDADLADLRSLAIGRASAGR
jgi:hypothetical protein